jgi:DNA-3-methyladenine glycosylase
MTRFRQDDFGLPAKALATRLLGAMLVREEPGSARRAGMIVETEAYLGVADRACHSFGGRRTPRVEPMYARAGTAYVYFTYGMHHCFNVVAGEIGEPVAVLIRALEPVEGLELIRECRSFGPRERRPDTLLCSGPARLCEALDIDRRHSGIDLADSSEIWIETGHPIPPRIVRSGPRIGVAYAGEPWVSRRLRFWMKDNPHVSRSK